MGQKAAVLDLRPLASCRRCTDIWFIARSPRYTTLETALTNVTRRILDEKELRRVHREGVSYRDAENDDGKIRSYTTGLFRKGSGYASRYSIAFSVVV